MDNQEGAFKGQAIYDGRQAGYTFQQQQQQQQQWQQPPPQPAHQQRVNFPSGMMVPTRDGPFQLPGQLRQQSRQMGGGSPVETAEYPHNGSISSCDACGE